MTPAEYANIKDAFARAILIPVEQREAFLQKECGVGSVAYLEVKSLLRHHQDDSILSQADRPVVSIEVTTPSEADSYLVLSDAWEENRDVFRRRLVIIATIFAILSAVSMLRLATTRSPEWGYGIRVFAAAVSLVIAWSLYRSPAIRIRNLRIAEWLVMAIMCLLEVAIYVRWMRALASIGDAATAVSVNDWHYITWTMVIVVYGVFMPNTWQRAARVLLPFALIPTIVSLIVSAIDPGVAELLDKNSFGEPFLTPIAAAGIAIYAAHAIQARVSPHSKLADWHSTDFFD